jgi:glutamate N-acetyltransferase/amino-acid N-acetyltransferase
VTTWRVVPIDGGVTAPAAFRAAGVSCGVKASGALDLALVAADQPATAAGLFTTNKVQAAPVLVSKEHLKRSRGRAMGVVINSGCANACTGEAGLEAARRMAAEAARALVCATERVLVASTGVIGVLLDIDKVVRGIAEAKTRLRREAHLDAARAIMTTDREPKSRAVEVETDRGTFRVGGMAKGAGMIEPHLATMLAVLTTDAKVPAPVLRRALVDAAADTFNAITIDGDMSTNDTLVALASGASGVEVDDELAPALTEGLRAVSRALALAIVRGGEGATKLVAVHATGAATLDEARRAARTVANSLLVKTAVHGGDPNWGRILAAAGRAGVTLDLAHCRVKIGPIVLFEAGVPFDERAPDAAAVLREPEIDIEVDLGTGGPHCATVWTCDLSADYVRINAEYRT